MIRAPSGLPFALEPSASPQQMKYTQMYQQQMQLHQQQQLQAQDNISNQRNSNSRMAGPERFITNACRAGPLPYSKRTCTDISCLLIYLALLITTIVLFCINYFSGKITASYKFDDLHFLQKLAYALNETLPQVLFACLCLVVIGILFVILVLLIPVIVGYLFLLLCIALLAFIAYSLIVLDWVNIWVDQSSTKEMNVKTEVIKYSLVAITCLGIIFEIVLICRRKDKLKHLGSLMRVVKVVLSQNIPVFPLFSILVMSGISAGVWCGFCKLMWNCIKMTLSSDMPIPPIIIIILGIILWFWTHGFIISLADFICESWVIYWYFNSNENIEQGEQVAAFKQNWKLTIFKNLFRFHLGTCLYGIIVSAFVADSIIRLSKRTIQRRSSKSELLMSISRLSRYCYIETIMESFAFCMANRQMYMLRQRIKSKLPEIYMLGHFLEQITKILLPIAALYLWCLFTYEANFLNSTVVALSSVEFILFCLLVVMGVFLEVSTNIAHLFGIVSDTAVIVYSIDCEIERVHYDQNTARSVPIKLKQALRKLQINIVIDDAANKKSNIGFNNQTAMNDNLYPNISTLNSPNAKFY